MCTTGQTTSPRPHGHETTRTSDDNTDITVGYCSMNIHTDHPDTAESISAPGNHYNVSILCVEDDPVTVQFYTKVLSPMAAEFYTATNGREGVLAFAKHTPDIVITDIMMPRMDGISMLKSMHQIRDDIRIIIATAFENNAFLKEAIQLGVVSYLSKPIRRESLLAVVQQCAHKILRNRNLEEQKRLNETMVMSLPMPAILFQRPDLEIIAANDSADRFAADWDAMLQSDIFNHFSRPAEGQEDVFDALPVTDPLRLKSHEAYDRTWDITLRRVNSQIGLFTAVDVTHRVQMERELEIARDFSDAILDNSFDGIAVVTTSGEFKFISPGMTRIFGDGVLYVTTIEELLASIESDGEKRKELQQRWDRDATREAPPERIIRFAQEEGSTRWVRLRLSPMPGGDLVLNCQDISQLKEAEQQVKYLAMHDPLTDLPNRQLLSDRLRLALSQAKRRETLLGVLFIDLDGFKVVNDTYGHARGDLLLRRVAGRLRETLRDADTVARLGGDEFVALCPDLHGREEAMTIAGRIIENLKRPFQVEGAPHSLGASIGLSLFPEHGETADALLSHADTAMYQVKNSGGNKARFFLSPDEQQPS